METFLHIIPECVGGREGVWRRAWPEVLACVATARADGENRHVMLVLGGSAFGRDAAALGATDVVRIAPALGEPRRARRAVEHVIDATDAGRVVTWEAGADEWVAGLRGMPDRRAKVDLNAGQVECRSLDGETGEVLRHWTTLRAGALSIPSAGPREALRDGLGVEASTRVVGVIGDWPARSHAMGYALGMLGVSGIACVGLAERNEPWRGPLLRHVREGGHIEGLVFADLPSVALWPACDAWLLAGTPGERVGVGWASVAQSLTAMGSVVMRARSSGLATEGVPESWMARSEEPVDLARTLHRMFTEGGVGAATPVEGPSLGNQIAAALRGLEVLA